VTEAVFALFTIERLGVPLFGQFTVTPLAVTLAVEAFTAEAEAVFTRLNAPPQESVAVPTFKRRENCTLWFGAMVPTLQITVVPSVEHPTLPVYF
jgi:hypothetical protein